MVNPLDALRLRLINASAHSNETFDTQEASRLDGRQTNTKKDCHLHHASIHRHMLIFKLLLLHRAEKMVENVKQIGL